MCFKHVVIFARRGGALDSKSPREDRRGGSGINERDRFRAVAASINEIAHPLYFSGSFSPSILQESDRGRAKGGHEGGSGGGGGGRGLREWKV